MLKDKVASLKKEYDRIKSKKSEGELELKDMKELVAFKSKVKKAIKSLNKVLQALSEAEEYGRTFSTARVRIKREIKNLEVLKETI